MPEGDTVYLAGRRLHAALTRQRLVRGELRHPRLSTVDLAGRRVLSVRSVGKHLLIRFDDGTTLHTHFRMDGSWHLYRPGERWRGPVHQVRAVLATEHRVAVGFRLHDMALVPTSEEHRLVGHLGPDLLDPVWGRAQEDEAVRRLTRVPDREVGVALLDQTAVAGLGNLYKTEVCFLLGISPWTPVSDVDVRAAIRWSRKLLLRNAARPEQSTTGELGRDAQHWVYERVGRPCRRCGEVVRSAPQGGGTRARVTYYCPRCQSGPYP
ncbi:endonuclease VIII [Longimycelium tulufanense]|uniref:DNA-(apurinic or apyrimidinic site) lyase n=1 Tax=Longimycelium tulufanense TaxID=907463 RepID=A0A8J3FSG6_9PSEU|nr:DNA-formamidopyrimidine glycosylase family protein [Longimycelium tulufanense]GGM38004.1 endonuclease VIII [Longimycelium tulufanense]